MNLSQHRQQERSLIMTRTHASAWKDACPKSRMEAFHVKTSTESRTHPHALRGCTVDVDRTDRLLGKHSEEAQHDGMRQHPPWAGRAEVKQTTVMRLLHRVPKVPVSQRSLSSECVHAEHHSWHCSKVGEWAATCSEASCMTGESASGGSHRAQAGRPPTRSTAQRGMPGQPATVCAEAPRQYGTRRSAARPAAQAASPGKHCSAAGGPATALPRFCLFCTSIIGGCVCVRTAIQCRKQTCLVRGALCAEAFAQL